MYITQEILEDNGYKVLEGLSFPFNVTPLLEHPDTKVYIVDTTTQDDGEHYVWMWGITGREQEKETEGEGTTIEEFNEYLKKFNFEPIKLDNVK